MPSKRRRRRGRSNAIEAPGAEVHESAKRSAGGARRAIAVRDGPYLNGIDALAQLKKNDPRVKVVFLTMHREVAYARRALEAGASGFVLKHSASDQLVTAIRAALNGQKYITPVFAGEVLESMQSDPKSSSDPLSSLTPRQ